MDCGNAVHPRTVAVPTEGCNVSGRAYDYVVVREVSPEPRSLEAVYRASWLPLTRLAYLLVGDRTEAEDVVQTVFMTAAARWDRIDEPWAYLRRAVVNRTHDAHRRTFRPPAVVTPGESPAEPELDEAWRFVQALPVAQRTVVVLRFYEDLGLTEIASLLGRPASTVRSDLRRALTKLKGSLV
jgi:RNA polymerase sigma factor (sigma-70 family)